MRLHTDEDLPLPSNKHIAETPGFYQTHKPKLESSSLLASLIKPLRTTLENSSSKNSCEQIDDAQNTDDVCLGVPLEPF